MALVKDDPDDSSSSGDVIIEHWSEGDSDDVICVDSSVDIISLDKSKEVDSKNVDDDSDSDSDCIIVEKDNSDDKQDEGPSLTVIALMSSSVMVRS